MYKFYQTVPVLLCLCLLSTPISAGEAKAPVPQCAEPCADIAKELARQEQTAGEHTQNESGASETTVVTQPVSDPSKILEFLKMCVEVLCP